MGKRGFSRGVACGLALVVAVACLAGGGLAAGGNRSPVRVAAAASLAAAAEEIGTAFTAKSGIEAVIIAAASSTLARQIAGGAEIDVFLSADMQWVEWLAERDLIIDGSERMFAGNALVLAVVPGSPLRPGGLAESLAALGSGRIVTGDPAHVPLGTYTRQALEAAGEWKRAQNRLLPMENAAAATRLVATGQAAAGILYASDAEAAGLKTLYRFPPIDPPIAYVAALVSGRGEAVTFLGFLAGEDGRRILCGHGLALPAGTPC